jgi:hypothetical protein
MEWFRQRILDWLGLGQSELRAAHVAGITDPSMLADVCSVNEALSLVTTTQDMRTSFLKIHYIIFTNHLPVSLVVQIL